MNKLFENNAFVGITPPSQEDKHESFFRIPLQMDEIELDEFRYVDRAMGLICTKLLSAKPSEMSELAFKRAIRKVSSFIELMDFDFNSLVDELVFDDIDEDCIDISFHRRKDLNLNIYFEESDIDNSVTEAFLSFTSKGKLKIMNDSLPNIVEVIKSLL